MSSGKLEPDLKREYTVEIPHFYCLNYIEGEHVLKVEVDLRDLIPALDINAISTWEPPYQDEPISKQQREQIIRNIYQYLCEVKGFAEVEIIMD